MLLSDLLQAAYITVQPRTHTACQAMIVILAKKAGSNEFGPINIVNSLIKVNQRIISTAVE
jgi:hypothetical protein